MAANDDPGARIKLIDDTSVAYYAYLVARGLREERRKHVAGWGSK